MAELADPRLVPVRPLGADPMHPTVLARETGSGRLVVHQVVPARDIGPAERALLTQESALLPSLRLVWDGDDLAVVRSYVEGSTLREQLALGPLPVLDALALARRLLRQLRALHAHGCVHAGVRPSSIVLTAGGAVLLDSDIARAPHLQRLLHATRSIDAAYLAPEQAGLIDRPVSARTDLYVLGLVLFEALTGRRAYPGPGEREVLHQQLSAPVPSVTALRPAVASAVDGLVLRLLRKDPADRHQDALEALADVAAVEAALLARDRAPRTSSVEGRVLAEPVLAGRDTQLAELLLRAEDARHGTASCVVLSAVSGGGKTALLDAFSRHVEEDGGWVLRGGGAEGVEQAPLQVLVGVVEGIVQDAAAARALFAQVGGADGPHAGALREVLPALRPLLRGTDAADRTEVLARSRVVGALVALLRAIGTPERPVGIVLDDCQWADELTVEVLTTLAREAAAAGTPAHFLLVVALRRQDVPVDHPLLVAPGLRQVPLPPLSAAEVAEVVISMAGDVPPAVTDLIAELSRGEPLMVSAVLRGLVEGGALRVVRGRWELTTVEGGWQASWESAAVLQRRVALLEAGTRDLLRAGAVYGRSFLLDAAADLAGCNAAEAADAIAQALERNLIWDQGSGRFAIVHDRLRASLLTDLPLEAVTDLHLRAAALIESRDPSRAFELAHHFAAAGQAHQALPYALVSAADARSRMDLQLAERYYLIAERGMAEAPDETQYEVSEALGQILVLRGLYDEAAVRYGRARSLARDDVSAALMEGRLGELVFRRDDLEGAAAHFEAGLVMIGERLPHSSLDLAVGLSRELLLRAVSGVTTRLPLAPVEDGHDLLRAHLYTQLQYPRWFHSHRAQTMWLMLRQVNTAERCPGSRELAHAYGVWGGALTLTFPFLWRRGLHYVELSHELAHGRHDVRGEGHAASMRACVLHAAGRYAEAEQAAARAIELLGLFGDRWETSFAARNRAMCLYRLGRTSEALEEAGRVHRLGLELGDANAEVTGLEVLAKASQGRVRTAQTHQALLRRGADIEVLVSGLQADALRLRHDGDLDSAVERLSEAADVVRRAQPTNAYVVPALAWLATVQRERAERELLPGERRKALREARSAAARALRYALVFRNELPHALRERAVVSALSGGTKRARWLLRKSAAAAVKREAWGELSATHEQAGRLGLASTLPPVPAGAHVEVLHGIAETASLGLADRFEALLEAGVRLAAADSSQEIVAAVHASALALLRADRVEVGGVTASWTAPDDAALQRLAQRGRPLVFDALSAEELGALVPPGVRSALAAPVLVRGQLVGWFLATHDQVGQLFGEDEERLAELIAKLAAAAIERLRVQYEATSRVVAAQEAERSRVARDLHDEIGQALTSVLLGVRLVEVAEGTGELLSRTEELRRTVSGGLDSVQRLAFDLRPAVLDDLGLVAALRRLTERSHGDVVVELETLDLDETQRFAPELETTAYRIVQESLTNVVRHAGATRCSVIAGCDARRLRLVVEDDGCGFDVAGAPQRLGLRGMGERAALIGGSLRVDSDLGEGTSVVFEAPL